MKLSDYARNLREGIPLLDDVEDDVEVVVEEPEPELPPGFDEYVCDWCGKTFMRRAIWLRRERHFCSKSCQFAVARREQASAMYEQSKWKPRERIPQNTRGKPGWTMSRRAWEDANVFVSRDDPPVYAEGDPADLIEKARKGVVYAETIAPEPVQRDLDPLLRLEIHAKLFALRKPQLVARWKAHERARRRREG